MDNGENWSKVIGATDKRQITAVFAGTLSGKFLPPQLIRHLPTDDVPSDWDITFTENHGK